MSTFDVELKAGEMVGEYRVEGKIGEGSFGQVYAAIHPVIGKRAAIKVLSPAFATNANVVSRFVAEARAVNQIQHRNIIDIFSFGTLPSGLHYFVMELLEGKTFDAYLRERGPLPLDEALPILGDIARALEAAHKSGIAHRDLKPENVFLAFDGEGGCYPKLLDFGIAKLLGDQPGSHRTATGMPIGTPLYMSPEQCKGAEVDHRTDIYAFGVLVHETLTGQRPFDGGSVMEIMMAHMSAPAPALSTHRPDLPGAVADAVLRMLEKDPADRPQSVRAAFQMLADAAQAPAAQPASDAGTSTSAYLMEAGLATAVGLGPREVAPTRDEVALAATEAGLAATEAGLAATEAGLGPHAAAGPSPTTTGGGGWVASPMTQPEATGPRWPSAPGAPYAAPPMAHGHASGPMAGPMGTAPPSKSMAPWIVAGVLGSALFLLLMLIAIGLLVSDTEASLAQDDVDLEPPAPEPEPVPSVTIANTPPPVGTRLQTTEETMLKLDVSLVGQDGVVLSVTEQTSSAQELVVVATSPSQVTEAEAKLSRHEVVTQETARGKPPGAPKRNQNAHLLHKPFRLTADGTDVTASGPMGAPIAPDVAKLVKSKSAAWLAPRPAFLARPVSQGEIVDASNDDLAVLFDMTDPSSGVVESGRLTFRSTRELHGREVAMFDVETTVALHVPELSDPLRVTVKGSLDLDLATGWTVQADLAGPVGGTVTHDGVQMNLAGSVSMRMSSSLETSTR